MRPVIVTLLLLFTGIAQAFEHATWDALLNAHVQWVRGGVTSQVDYDGLATDKKRLEHYLDSLSAVSEQQFRRFDRDQQLSFLINAYNAFTVKLILDQKPRPDSIRDIGSLFSGPWDQRFFELLGAPRTLDEVEHDLIRGNPELMDPRIHFAVNCASVGCPALRPEAYTAERLDRQLEDSTRRFLSDRQRNRYDADRNRLAISPIFKWYRDDFADAAGTLHRWLARYHAPLALSEDTAEALRRGILDLSFMSYDWSLNSAR